MVNITLNIVNITIREDGNYSVQVTPISGGDTYTVILTPAQCADLPTIQTTINNIAQPLKFKNQQITITL